MVSFRKVGVQNGILIQKVFLASLKYVEGFGNQAKSEKKQLQKKSLTFNQNDFNI